MEAMPVYVYSYFNNSFCFEAFFKPLSQLRLFKMKDFEAAAEFYSAGIAKFATRKMQQGDAVLLSLEGILTSF